MYYTYLINKLVERAAETVADRVGMSIQQLHEPEITDALVTELPTELNRFLLSNLGVRFGGCYIHQKPKAYFKLSSGGNTSREIGDLLVICRQIIDGIETFNAVIFQMKMHDNGIDKHQISNQGELEQLFLYQHWPVFDCYQSQVKTSFDIYPKSPCQGALYALACRKIRDHQLLIFHSLPAKQISLFPNLTFGEFLLDFIINQKGCVITSRADNNKDEWSRLIWYLIDMSWKSVYNLKRVGRNIQPRIGGDFFNIYSLITKTDEFIYEKLPNFETSENDGNLDLEIEGIPLLLIDAGENFQQRLSNDRYFLREMLFFDEFDEYHHWYRRRYF